MVVRGFPCESRTLSGIELDRPGSREGFWAIFLAEWARGQGAASTKGRDVEGSELFEMRWGLVASVWSWAEPSGFWTGGRAYAKCGRRDSKARCSMGQGVVGNGGLHTDVRCGRGAEPTCRQ